MENIEKRLADTESKLIAAQSRIAELEARVSEITLLHTAQDDSVQELIKRLQTLQALDHAMLSATSLETLAQFALNHIVQFIPCFRASIATVDLKAKTTYLLAVHSEVEVLFPSMNTYPLDETYIPAIAREPWVIIDNLSQSKNQNMRQLYEQGIRSILLVPLWVESKLVGLLNLHSVQTNFFSEETIQIAVEVGQQIAIGIHKASLSDAVAHYAKRMEILHLIDRGLIEATSIQKVVQTALKYIRNLIPCQRVNVGLIDMSLREGVIFAADYEGDTTLREGLRVTLLDDFFDGYDSRYIKFVPDLRVLQESNPRFKQAVQQGLRSGLNVLLMDRDQPVGTLGLFSNTLGFFTTEHQDIIIEIGSQLVIAIRQLQLSEQLAQYTLTLEEKVAERTAELQMSKDQIEAILINSLDGIFLIDRNLQIQQANPAVGRLLSTELEDQDSVNLLDLIHPSYANHIRASVEKALTEQLPVAIEIQADRQDGKTNNLELNFGHIPGDGFVSTLHDITARKQAEEALKQALEKEKELSKERSHFVSVVSHEFRTPLASILMMADTLLTYRKRLDEVKIDEKLERIRQTVWHMTAIMEDTLQLGRIQAGHLEFHPHQGDLDAFCRGLIEEFEDMASGQNRFAYTTTHTPVNIAFDDRLIKQAMTNLFSNALKYSPADKPAHVDLVQEPSRVIFSVTDHGIGIPDEDLEHLFEPFHRASNTGSISGTGLGLSITKQIIELHGGTINVESQVGRGTTFRVIIPRI